MTYTIWHNPRCSKSRQTLALLQENGISPEIRLYLTNTPSREELEEVLKLLDIKPIKWVRTKESEWKEMGLTEESSKGEIIDALEKFPKLIERPVVIKGDKKAVLGRPPENIFSVL